MGRLAEQARTEVAAGEEPSLQAGERRGVDAERHRQRRLVDLEWWQRLDRVDVAQGVGDPHAVHPGDAHDIARARLGELHALEAAAREHRQHPSPARLAGGRHHRHRAARRKRPPFDAADADDAHVAGVVEGAHLHLKRSRGVRIRRWHPIDDEVEQGRHVGGRTVGIRSGDAEGRGGEHHREVELLVARAEAVEEIEDLVDHLVGAGTVAVDLVDDDDGAEAGGERLARHEAGLGHRALHRVHHQQHRVDHRQDPLHLAAEVGVARRVHDVDAASRVLDRGGLRQDRDAALALQVVAVERPLGDHGTCVGRGLLQQPIHERGLAMVDVGDDGDVADVHRKQRGRSGARDGTKAPESTWFRPLARYVPAGCKGYFTLT